MLFWENIAPAKLVINLSPLEQLNLLVEGSRKCEKAGVGTASLPSAHHLARYLHNQAVLRKQDQEKVVLCPWVV